MHAACALQTPYGRTRDAEPSAPCRFNEGLQERGRQRCGRNHGLLSLSPAPPHGGKQCSPTQQGKAARRKKPQPGTVRVSPYKPPSLSLERTSQRHVGQVSWLAAFPYSLHLPEMRHLSGFCRFRSAHSCGAAMASHHLPCSQRLSCEATWLSSTSKLFLYPIVISSMLSRAIMRCPCAHATMVHDHVLAWACSQSWAQSQPGHAKAHDHP